MSLNSSMSSLALIISTLFLLPLVSEAHSYSNEEFLQCLASNNSTSDISKVVYTPQNSSYSSVLQFSMKNLRFNTATTPKPVAIITPVDVSQIQAAITCSRKHGLQIRVRSGGHDFEGLSSVSILPFVIVDFINLRSVTVDVENINAWVQSGATLGELYYKIAEKSKTLAFPAGSCPSIGVGGHFSGGGYGPLLRKYGFAVDNIIDAQLVDVNGRILDRSSMGEDLFWAIRGGGGNTFGIVVSWKINLVPVPPTVTVFSVVRVVDDNAAKLVNRWQYVANKLDEHLTIYCFLISVDLNGDGRVEGAALFSALFLGGVDRLLRLVQEKFPEMGLKRENCTEMSWIESILYFAGLPSNTSVDALLNRTSRSKSNVKLKSDYVKEPVPENAWGEIWKRLNQVEIGALVLVPYGGKMSEIPESSTPYPHRAGNLFKVGYVVDWNETDKEASRRHISWIRKLYKYMTPYVSKNPREAYVNYRDLDIGRNNYVGNTSYRKASIWGTKYFKNNFDRLVRVKTEVDPGNFFRNEQSIPPLLT
ncbi:hypothetical protein K2173_000515 [Erythroxylum novogranatense]|uniref:FAD-binding PCMH-type domain-containing protein n=1 Tax=Erythroxylum novogranatense TaxID=1862640 RepID=A0AAV8SXF2_9ROSI|nr:hypothetical protein K2173_000515 [Erythroxylum novogranatense]